MARAVLMLALGALIVQSSPPADLAPGFGTARADQNVDVRLQALIPALEKNLRDNIIAFWYPATIDREHGGYILDHGPRGERKGEPVKMIVTQARQVWLFSQLVRHGYGGMEMLEAAETGYRFLRDWMWDREHGGFYWEVDVTGSEILRPHKHLYGQAFALYALSEYAMASRSQEALDLAIRLFDLLETRAHDAEYGGYQEFFARDWSAAPEGESPYVGSALGLKLMNTHLHLMEAVSTFYRASQLPRARDRLLELITIQSNAVVRKDPVACTDQHQRDWTPLLDETSARVSYGHDLENIWLLAEAMDAAGQSTWPLGDLYRALFAYSRRHGYDERNGGFYDSGAIGRSADRLDKIWWVQAEALVSALTMYRLTREPAYAAVFEKTWEFVDRQQTDWEHGEWHATITADGEPRGDKASRWKAGYHNGRAMLECLRILKNL
jgi:cellobiose epimerase